MGEGMYCILAFARIVATTVEFHLSVGNPYGFPDACFIRRTGVRLSKELRVPDVA